MKLNKKYFFVTALIIISLFSFSFANTILDSVFTPSEHEIIKQSQIKPIKVGIIPNIYPMSVCPPENQKFDGIVVDLLKLISTKSGLQFEFVRIPIEKYSPIRFLKTGEVDAVAGVLKFHTNMEDSEIILSDALFDATVAFVAKKGIDLSKKILEVPVKVGIINGYEPGIYYAKKFFPNCQIVQYKSPTECLDAINHNKIDISIINKYAVSYQLQKPMYSKINVINPQSINLVNCIALKSDKTELQNIINKALSNISERENHHILLEFIINNPYKLTLFDFMYKYQTAIVSITFLLIILLYIINKFNQEKRIRKNFYYDSITKLFSREGFEIECDKIIKSREYQKLYLINFDILRFDNFTAVYGNNNAESLLSHIAKTLHFNLSDLEISARISENSFITLLNADDLNEITDVISSLGDTIPTHINNINVMLNYGIYCIEDTKIPVKLMIDMAITAKQSIKRENKFFYAVYDKSINDNRINSMNIILSADSAFENEEFYITVQPKFNTWSEKIVGGEALVRWKKSDGTLVMPGEFIELFEKNGKIVKLDFYVLEKVCKLQNEIFLKGITPFPISVNFSRNNLYDENFVQNIINMLNKYNIPPSFIEIELTESVLFVENTYLIHIVNELHKHGFIFALDDFGSGYSSLNSLKDLAIDVLKLDRGFIDYKGDAKKIIKGQKIIRHLLNMVKSIGISCVAEGVETKEQLEFLRSCGGCDIVQGFYFSKPIPASDYKELVINSFENH